MRPRFVDAASGAAAPLSPESPPKVRVFSEGEPGSRARVLSDALERALSFLGYAPERVVKGQAELWLTASRPVRPGIWLKLEDGGRRADAPEARLNCLRAHYSRPWAPSPAELERSRGELARLREAASLLESFSGQMPSDRALAGYRSKLASALADDFDAPRALETLWAALRPGALSPGTRWAALKLADSALGLL